jgi:predicted Zn-dependent peptidase
MKQIILFFLFIFSLLVVTTVTAEESLGNLSKKDESLQRYTLDNGLRVWCWPRSSSESVVTFLVVRTGSRYETSSNNGISHYVEHMLFTGTERWTDEKQVKDVITRRGGLWNGWTREERTTYYAQVSAQDVDIALDWLAQLVFHPTFPADKVDKERQVIFQERWGRYGWLINKLDALGFGYELNRDVRRALFPNSTLGLRIGGEDTSLESLGRMDLLDYYQRRYTPDNAVLIVVGHVQPEQIVERAKVYFGNLEKKGPPSLPDTPPLTAQGPHKVTIRGPFPTDQMRLMVGAQTVGVTHPDRWALEVLAEILEEDLDEEIRSQQGLVYGLGVYNVFFDDTGYFVVSTRSKRNHKETILSTIEKHLERVRQGKVGAERVVEAVTTLKGRWTLSTESNLELAQWLEQWSSVFLTNEPIPDYPTAIGMVTPEDLSRVMATYFTPQHRYLGIHLPIVTLTSGAGIVGILVGLGLCVGVMRKWRRRVK